MKIKLLVKLTTLVISSSLGGYKYKLKNGEEKDTPPMIGLCNELKNYMEKLDEKGRWSF